MLNKENKDLTIERDKLRTENDNLIEKRMIYWFLAGAGVFFFGWMSGKLSRKKKKYY
jgi:SH3 domain protein